MGMSDDFVASGETEQEVIDKMMKHAREMHSDMMMSKTKEEMMDMQNAMKMKIRNET
jgi:predicted small metal-binding protein